MQGPIIAEPAQGVTCRLCPSVAYVDVPTLSTHRKCLLRARVSGYCGSPGAGRARSGSACTTAAVHNELWRALRRAPTASDLVQAREAA